MKNMESAANQHHHQIVLDALKKRNITRKYDKKRRIWVCEKKNDRARKLKNNKKNIITEQSMPGRRSFF